MHDIRLIRDDPAAFDEGLRRRGLEPLSGELIALDERRRAAISALQIAQEDRNRLSQEIGQAKKAKDEARATSLMEDVTRLKSYVPELEEAERASTKALNDRLAEIPNAPNPEVPEGRDETGNVLRHEWGAPRALANPKQHFELGEAMRQGGAPLMDFEAAAKLSGSRFVVLRGQLARLERALGQFMLDLHTGEHGYTEVAPPLLVRDEVMFGTAQLPKFAEDQFRTERSAEIDDLTPVIIDAMREFLATHPSRRKDGSVPDSPQLRKEAERFTFQAVEQWFNQDLRLAERDPNEAIHAPVPLWLTPTAEVTLTNLVRESIIAEDELPLRMTALTPCFRAEAGAAGRDTRGMLRQHQFIKCELVSITAPDKSAEEHERMLACAEAVLQKLELPYRVITLCTGDMGFASAKTYDIEVLMPGQALYREISSCSVCNDFQARRMNARYRPKGEKGARFVHTLNGSGVAVGRALIAVMENYQNPDGSVTIPSALAPYMGGITRIESAA